MGMDASELSILLFLKSMMILKWRRASRPRIMSYRQGAVKTRACSSGRAMSRQSSGNRVVDKVTCRLELNSPAIVTPEMASVREGTMPGGNDLSLNQEVLEPESQRMRKG